MSNSLSGGQDIVRQTLIDRLLDAVKQCQIRFGGKTELASEKDSRISCLCAQWVTALQFGLKLSKKMNPLRHVTGQVLLRTEGQSVFWQFVKEHLSATETRRFNSLQNVNTDAGRAHAWLRSTLNEQSLEKYLHSFLGNRQLLSAYYGQDALLMDEERSSMLPMMAAGLSSILFAINIDNAEFNVSKQGTTSSGSNILVAPLPVVQISAWKAPSPMYALSGAPAKEKKRRKKKKANIAQIENIEFDDEENGDESKTSHESNGNSNSAANTSLTLTNRAREISESSRRVDDANNYKAPNATKEYREIYENSQSSPNSVSSAQDTADKNSRTGSADWNEIHINSGFNVFQNAQDESKVVPEMGTDALLDKTDKNQKELGSFESSKTENYDTKFGARTQTGLSNTPTITGNEDSYSYKEKVPEKTAKSKENRRSSAPRLSISLENSSSAQNSEQHTSGGFLDETIDEPLVDLNSGVALTPVACPDEARAWALAESDDSESPGNEGGVGFPVTSRLFAGSSRDSPVSSICTDEDVSDDTSWAIGATAAAISATQEMADFTSSALVRTMGDGRMSPPSESSSTKEMTSGELKQAIVSMMLRKDEVEECNRSLRQLLDKEMMESASLRLQVDDLKRDLSSSTETHHATVHALTSENDLLKHQLKKYVAAVQSLRRNEPSDIAVPGARQLDDLPVLADEPHDQASDEEKRDFERKLIQVADMHGELIELNERLQKMLNIREHQLRRLREELIDLRGPLPDDGSHDDSASLDDFGPRLISVNTRPLINIWIPSAFAQGKSNVHHTYQVYVRIKDDEWNVYRRYSDFYGLHKKISKQYPTVSQFKFPQKKVLGNRDAKFVEIRRRHLQSYLRKLINYSLRVIPELSENPCKTTLLKCFSFFGQTSKEAAVPTSSPNTPAHYTGL
ncbi:sorting nexin-29 isoform X3 [Paramuricea clavata]|uniref:Sorting nexin-29 isoform X3 n=1 Tax=Paramuricea clavata TaxID=317549 RepID=A0A6S7GQ67_PARCT|nr:sorting nexin-29 isoform X3 [Paramuricea clavata]